MKIRVSQPSLHCPPGCIWFADGHLLARVLTSPAVGKAANDAAICFADGTAVQVYWWCKTGEAVNRWTGSQMLGAALSGQLIGSIGVVGGDEVKLRRLMRAHGTKVSVVCPPVRRKWTRSQVRACLNDLARHSPDGQLPVHIFVALGAPKQELWMQQATQMVPGYCRLYGIGAAVDFVTGQVARAPLWAQKWHLEWLYRLVREPRRLSRRYVWTGAVLFSSLFWSLIFS